MFVPEHNTIFISQNRRQAVRLANPEGRSLRYYQALLFRYGSMFGFKRFSKYITSENWVDIRPDATTLTEVGVRDESLVGKTNIETGNAAAKRMLCVCEGGVDAYYFCVTKRHWTCSSKTSLRRPKTIAEKFEALPAIAKTADVLITRDERGALTFECSYGPLFIKG